MGALGNGPGYLFQYKGSEKGDSEYSSSTYGAKVQACTGRKGEGCGGVRFTSGPLA